MGFPREFESRHCQNPWLFSRVLFLCGGICFARFISVTLALRWLHIFLIIHHHGIRIRYAPHSLVFPNYPDSLLQPLGNSRAKSIAGRKNSMPPARRVLLRPPSTRRERSSTPIFPVRTPLLLFLGPLTDTGLQNTLPKHHGTSIPVHHRSATNVSRNTTARQTNSTTGMTAAQRQGPQPRSSGRVRVRTAELSHIRSRTASSDPGSVGRGSQAKILLRTMSCRT